MAPSIAHLGKFCFWIRCLSNTTDPYCRGLYKVSFHPRTLLPVICCVRKLRSNLSDILRRFNELETDVSEHFSEHTEEIYKLFRNSFVPQVEEFFKVPKVEQLINKGEILPKENEILAGFMDFLLQILNSEASTNPDKEQRYAILQKELTFLLTFLGDVPFQRTDLEEVKSLLTEFETVANEAASLIYSHVFANLRIEASSFVAQQHTLLEKVGLLNAMIGAHCSKLPELLMRFETPRTGVVDSLVILDSLIPDLENVINGRFDLPIDVNIKDQIKIVHNELTSSRALLEDMKLPHDTHMDELKESFVKVRDVTYEAEYLINLHVVENIHLWYLGLRLPGIIQKIKVIAIRLRETKKNYDCKGMGVSKYRSRKVSSLRARRTARVDNIVIGFEDNKIKILGDLIGGSNELKIISIFGMPGLGKTTIANKLYNDQSFRSL